MKNAALLMINYKIVEEYYYYYSNLGNYIGALKVRHREKTCIWVTESDLEPKTEALLCAA